MKIKAVLFDLDGTLADTAPDLADALNTVLINHDHAPLPFSIIRPAIGEGGKGLIRLGFKTTDDDTIFTTLIKELHTAYQKCLCKKTQLFPGIDILLKYLHDQQILWGIVTNKPAVFTQPLLKQLSLTHPPACIVSGDTVEKCKPHPEPLWHACKLINCPPAECLYIGDHERDIQAGKRAGMHTLAVSYGYIAATEKPELWGADGLVAAPEEILAWITTKRRLG